MVSMVKLIPFSPYLLNLLLCTILFCSAFQYPRAIARSQLPSAITTTTYTDKMKTNYFELDSKLNGKLRSRGGFRGKATRLASSSDEAALLAEVVSDQMKSEQSSKTLKPGRISPDVVAILTVYFVQGKPFVMPF